LTWVLRWGRELAGWWGDWEEGIGEGLLGYLGPVGRHATGTVTPRGGWR